VKERFIHSSAFVAPSAQIGVGTKVWHFAQIREEAVVGDDCILGTGVYVGERVIIGNRVKVENGASLFEGVALADGVFIGPHACLTNDRFPRAINANGSLKLHSDWQITPTTVGEGASLGAGTITIAGISIGRWALIGAGSIVARSVPDYAMAMGNPARIIGFACMCGRRLSEGSHGLLKCNDCGRHYRRTDTGLLLE
jgi:UDP-2-acetamido-3-amino-2,3-dideoxy-glucuronate N-acetyltransferase